MAISLNYLGLLDYAVSCLDQANRARAFCLSVPDILVGLAQLNAKYGERMQDVERRRDSLEILRYHGLPGNFGEIVDTRSFFAKCLRLDAVFFDAKVLRGYEEVGDLNEPLPPQHVRRYGLVIDSGTLEHCFNVGVAFKNMCDCVSVNGVVLTTAPVTMVNHGFYNFCPTIYVDGFLDNGFEILKMFVANRDVFYELDTSLATRRLDLPPESVMHCLARRKLDTQFKWPVQSKYKKMLF
jgi:hypothetical protein